MKLIDILTSLEDNDFIEIMEVTEGYSIDCYVKDSLKYLNKFKKSYKCWNDGYWLSIRKRIKYS